MSRAFERSPQARIETILTFANLHTLSQHQVQTLLDELEIAVRQGGLDDLTLSRVDVILLSMPWSARGEQLLVTISTDPSHSQAARAKAKLVLSAMKEQEYLRKHHLLEVDQ